MHRITFDVAQPVSPADPNRMDVACFIGFVPLRSSDRLPDSLHSWLTRNHWAARVLPSGSAPGYELLDVPVPVESWEGYQTLFAGEHRLDGEIEIPGDALMESLVTAPDDGVLHVSLNGVTKGITLPSGKLPLPEVVAGINAARIAAGLTPVVLPEETMIGSLLRYITSADPKGYQPTNSAFGLLPPAPAGVRKKADRNLEIVRQCLLCLYLQLQMLSVCCLNKCVGQNTNGVPGKLSLLTL